MKRFLAVILTVASILCLGLTTAFAHCGHGGGHHGYYRNSGYSRRVCTSSWCHNYHTHYHGSRLYYGHR